MWLKQPLVDLEAICARHDAVEAFTTDPELRERLRDQSFRGKPQGRVMLMKAFVDESLICRACTSFLTAVVRRHVERAASQRGAWPMPAFVPLAVQLIVLCACRTRSRVTKACSTRSF